MGKNIDELEKLALIFDDYINSVISAGKSQEEKARAISTWLEELPARMIGLSHFGIVTLMGIISATHGNGPHRKLGIELFRAYYVASKPERHGNLLAALRSLEEE